MFCSTGSLAKFCDEHKLPYGAFLISSLKMVSQFLLQKIHKHEQKKYGYEMYIGWYGKIINE